MTLMAGSQGAMLVNRYFTGERNRTLPLLLRHVPRFALPRTDLQDGQPGLGVGWYKGK